MWKYEVPVLPSFTPLRVICHSAGTGRKVRRSGRPAVAWKVFFASASYKILSSMVRAAACAKLLFAFMFVLHRHSLPSYRARVLGTSVLIASNES